MPHTTLRLGYIGLRGNKEEWKRFGADLFGLQPLDHGSSLRFRADEGAWRLSIEPGNGDPLAYVGLELDSDEALEAAGERLRAAGYEAIEEPALASERNVHRLLRTTGPDDTRIELFVGALTLSAPFASPNGARFVTGRRGIGHILLMVSDIERALHFYLTVLGLRRSDTATIAPGIVAHFLNGGCRHHVIALVSLPGLRGLDHLFMEVDHIHTVGQAWDLVQAGAAPVARSIGQHANDPAVSFYVQSPSGFLFEYGCQSLVIEDPATWVQTHWESAYLWGGTFGSHSVR